MANRFSTSRNVKAPSAKKIPMVVNLDYRGLDRTSPYDSIQKGRTPDAHDFRLYSENAEGRRVAISTRKGQGFYTTPLDETLCTVSNPYEEGILSMSRTYGDIYMVDLEPVHYDPAPQLIVEFESGIILSSEDPMMDGNSYNSLLIAQYVYIVADGSLKTHAYVPVAETGTRTIVDDEWYYSYVAGWQTLVIDSGALTITGTACAAPVIESIGSVSSILNYDEPTVDVLTKIGGFFHTVEDLTTLDAPIGPILNWRAMPFTQTSSTGRLSKVELLVRRGTGTGPLLVDIYSDNNGKPGDRLAESSIISSDIDDDYSWAPARFIEAPEIAVNTKYWIVSRMQEDGTGEYEWQCNYDTDDSMVSNANISGFIATDFSLSYKCYYVEDIAEKGMFRFNQINGTNYTAVVYNTTMYVYSGPNTTAIPIYSSLSSSASKYSFFVCDGKMMWVNSYDQLTSWNGVLPSATTNICVNPTFVTNTANWEAGSGSTLTRNTSVYYSTPASCKVTAASGTREIYQTISLDANKGVYVSAWVAGTSGSSVWITTSDNVAKEFVLTVDCFKQITCSRPICASALTKVQFYSTTNDFYIDDVVIGYSGIEHIIDAELPILSNACMHKDKIFGVVAAEPNKIVFSEDPGNPSNLAADLQWYHAWLSVSFMYVPAPKHSDPITAISSFQDLFTIFLANNKYVLYGNSKAEMTLRQATGTKGAVSQRGTYTDESYIYFVAQDGFYRYDGSKDERISDLIQSDVDEITYPENISITKWKRQIRWYYGSGSNAVNDSCFLFHTSLEEWQKDTNVYVKRAVYFGDNDDEGELLESSSLIPAVYLAEIDYNSLGSPIDFKYWLKYDSLGGPAQKKRILKYFPLIQGVGQSFDINVDMDKDLINSPIRNKVSLTASGAVWGAFLWGDGTTWGGSMSYNPMKLRYPGYAYYWQMRLSNKAVNNPVMFFGVQYSYKAKRL